MKKNELVIFETINNTIKLEVPVKFATTTPYGADVEFRIWNIILPEQNQFNTVLSIIWQYSFIFFALLQATVLYKKYKIAYFNTFTFRVFFL